MTSTILALMIWYGAGCWEDPESGVFVLVNTTVKENCQQDDAIRIQSGIQAIVWSRRDLAGLPVPDEAPPETPPAPPPEEPPSE